MKWRRATAVLPETLCAISLKETIMARSETVTISKCPICQGKHIFALKVERSVVIKMLTMNDLNETLCVMAAASGMPHRWF
jgi:hypothetical protein